MSRFIILVILVAVAACGGDGGTTTPPPPVSVAITPTASTINPGATAEFSATVTNATSTAVRWTSSGGRVAGNGSSATFTAPVTGGSYTVTATSEADPTKSASATVTVNSVGVAIASTATSVGAGDTLGLTANITNTANAGVTWTASAGSIVGSGAAVQWAAPVAGGSYTITVTSTFDPSRSATTTITVTPVVVAVAATQSTLFRGDGTTLTATVSGTSLRAVTWNASCGTIAGSGLSVQYTAPEAAGPCTVRAISVRDVAQSGSAVLTVRPVLRVATLTDTDDGACTFAHCSFREALNAANATPARDSILIASGNAPVTIALAASLPFITAPVDIAGPGADLLILNGGASSTTLRSLLYFDGAFTATVRGLTVRGGRRSGGGGMVVDNDANVTLRDMQIRNNESVDAPGGGILALRRGRVALINVDVTDNVATGANGLGGGVAVQDSSLMAMTGGRLANDESRVSNGGGARVFNGALTLDSVTLSGNRAPATANGGVGAGIFTDGPRAVLQLVNSTVSDNIAGVAGGGLSVRGGTTVTLTGTTFRANRAPLGGGIEIGNSNATVVNSTIAANVVTSRGGGVFVFGTGQWTQQGGAIRENVAGNNGGGGLWAQESAVVSLTNVQVRENRASGGGASGGGIWCSGNVTLDMTGGAIARNESGSAAGGLILTGGRPSTLTRVAVDSNVSAIGGGGLVAVANVNLTITDGSFRGNSLLAGGGAGLFAENSTLSLVRTIIAGNRAVLNGGGMQINTGGTYALRDVVVEDNSGVNGGGLGFNGAMTITVDGGIIRRNTASGVGGGLWKAGQSALTMTGTQILDNTAASQGGGVQLVAPGAAATLRRLTVRGNRATTASGGGVTAGVNTLIEESVFANNTTGAIGGGIFSAGTANTTVRNSTFSANSAVVGGGVAATGTIAVVNATFVANTASDFGGGIGTNNAGNLTATNLLLSGNLANGVAGDCGRGGTSLLTSGGGNLSADTSCVTFTQASDRRNTPTGVNLTLANNGGPTFTYALLEGSAAINAAVAASCPTTDQRGAARVGSCDIGAVEFGSTPSGSLVQSRASAAPTRGGRKP
jgi:CSLREA domain-containing protein